MQVKGHEVDVIKEKNFKFKMEKCELDAFLNDPVVYIVCQIQRGTKVESYSIVACCRNILRISGEARKVKVRLRCR